MSVVIPIRPMQGADIIAPGSGLAADVIRERKVRAALQSLADRAHEKLRRCYLGWFEMRLTWSLADEAATWAIKAATLAELEQALAICRELAGVVLKVREANCQVTANIRSEVQA